MANTQQQNKTISRFVALFPLGTTIIVYNTTTSMVPVIHAGQPIHITRARFDSVHIGDIIAYTKGKRRNIIVHRVVGRQKRFGIIGFVTKGDNIPQRDKYITYKQDFIGVVRL